MEISEGYGCGEEREKEERNKDRAKNRNKDRARRVSGGHNVLAWASFLILSIYRIRTNRQQNLKKGEKKYETTNDA